MDESSKLKETSEDKTGGASRSRTGLDGFAIRYITALLTRQILERETRLELATLTLARLCSTN